jgi:isoleucyl-tRNA synthetase
MPKPFKEFKELNFNQICIDILNRWKKFDIFKKSIESRNPDKSFTFYEGPPSANGSPGIHHVMARTVKDIFCRYKTLKGYRVNRKGGWDTHGLPVELQVEKELGITKEDIGKKISIADYNAKCRQTVMRYKQEWDDLTQKMGYWVDLENPYITFDNNYIESCWYLLKEFYDKSLLYKGYTIQPYSPAAGTGLSSHELNQPGCYRNVKDTSIVAQFQLKTDANHSFIKKLVSVDKNKVYILAWTTTPWTLPSNTALAVADHIDYALIKTLNPYSFQEIYVIVAKDLIGKYFNEKGENIPFENFKIGDKHLPWKKIIQFKGSELVGLSYYPILPYVQTSSQGKTYEVINGDFVSTDEGTGIVHIAPTFGADDARVAQMAGIAPMTVINNEGNHVPLVDKKGRFVPQIQDPIFGFGGEYVKEAYLTDEEKEIELKKQQKNLVDSGLLSKLDKYLSVDERIALKLKLENKAFKIEKYEHNYPHCWRTDKPILYYPLESWFIRTTAMKEKLVELNKKINWKPESTGSGRFGNWLENIVDWNLSRSRFWGTPLPIWSSDDGTVTKCIGSREELIKEIEKANKKLHINQPTQLHDLHRPYVDEILLVSDDGIILRREPDLVDVWFDSGAMPYAQWHYPFENQDVFNKNFPADFISEGVDQTRGWFFTLHVIAVMLFDNIAYKNVVSTGLVLDKNGEKMSKRKGNVINPFETIEKYGADATRWYMVSNSNPWDNLKFDLEGVVEVQRKLFSTLFHTYNFFAIYANLDGYIPDTDNLKFENLTLLDEWILSELNILIQKVDEAYADYDVTKAARLIESYVEQLSNWYVRLSRKRFWKGDLTSDKLTAYNTLYHCLKTVTVLMSPIAPFFSDWLYLNLNPNAKEDESVHLTYFPESDKQAINENIIEAMRLAKEASSLIHSIRKLNNLRVRLPLAKAYINTYDEKKLVLLEQVAHLIKEETNIKELYTFNRSSASRFFSKAVLPDLKKLGKILGPKIKELKEILSKLSQNEIEILESQGLQITFNDGTTYILKSEDVIIKTTDAPGLASAHHGEVTVAVDTKITEELQKEGIARDFVNRIQNLRKEKGFDVTDKILIRVEMKDELINSALQANKEYICSETQALQLDLFEKLTSGILLDMDAFELKVELELKSVN